MLIKTQVKRRTQAINNYILSLRDKVYTRRYRQAVELLKQAKQSVNNSYMAPYDPNTYLLDSLKAKNEKLHRERDALQAEVADKQQEINQIKMRRGYAKNTTGQGYESPAYNFVQKISIHKVGVYASRLTLRLEDTSRLDYEVMGLETDFHLLRILLDHSTTSIPYSQIISNEADDLHILLCWRSAKSSQSYIVFRFDSEEVKAVWHRCFVFCRLICESEGRGSLFFGREGMAAGRKDKVQANAEKESRQMEEKSSGVRFLDIGANKSPAFDRLRRKSDYYPVLSQNYNNLSLINRKSKSRKVSQDYSIKQAFGNKNGFLFDRKTSNPNKSQNEQDDLSLSNSLITKKQELKKQVKREGSIKIEQNSGKIERPADERQKTLADASPKQSQNPHHNRQIFFNESSIHWIEEQNDQQKSRSSKISKDVEAHKITGLEVFSKQGVEEHSEHISEVAAETEESPLLPHNLRQKKRLQKNNGQLAIRIKQVQRSDEKGSNSKKQMKESGMMMQNRSKKNSNEVSSKGSHPNKSFTLKEANRFSHEVDDQDDDEGLDEQAQNQSVNEDSEHYDSDNGQKKQQKSNMEIEDKSQDLMSENEDSQTESRKYGLDDLKMGIMVEKCSAYGWSSHVKKLFLSNNDMQICWKNQKGTDLKKINLLDVYRIQYKVITPGIEKHIKDIEKKRCMSIRYKEKDKQRILEFYLPQPQKIQSLEMFYEKLNSYWRHKISTA